MNINLQLAESFGPRLSDGYKAAEYRMRRVDPYIDLCEKIVLDFAGIRNANSSFMNALVAGAIEQHGAKALGKIAFKNCSSAIKVLVEAAIFLGMNKVQDKVA